MPIKFVSLLLVHRRLSTAVKIITQSESFAMFSSSSLSSSSSSSLVGPRPSPSAYLISCPRTPGNNVCKFMPDAEVPALDARALARSLVNLKEASSSESSPSGA